MNNYRTCENCKHFIMPEGTSLGVCSRFAKDPAFVLPTDICIIFEPRKNKVKPRRLCDFCERHKPLEDDYGRFTMEFTKLIPLESINLTTGERTEPKRNVEYALFLYEDADDGEVCSFRIRYCPLCGRKLGGEKDG